MTEQSKVKNHQYYFGRIIRFVDNNGNEYLQAFNVVDSQTDITRKEFTIRSIFYKSIESFELGEPPIPEFDGGIRKFIYRAESWDAIMKAQSSLAYQTATTIHGIFDSIKDTPKEDGSFSSFFEDAGEIILPSQS